MNDAQQISDYLDEVERARVKWACITSKTQRVKNDRWLLEVYENVTKLRPYIENVSYQQPPSREGKTVNKFSQKSRSRMLDKFRRMRKEELNLPFFITLTYHRNEMRGDVAKKHLNTFFQRFRRLCGKNEKFRYFWKMEKQKRGAIHFHLMFFPPPSMFPDGWNSSEKIKGKKETTMQNEYLKLRISAAWNEIAEPLDNLHLKAGTNCRPVFSWRMCTGYLAKYMEKEVSESQFSESRITGGLNPRKRKNYHYFEVTNETFGFERLSMKRRGVRCIKVCESKQVSENAGRFWGFSNNFNFECFYKGETSIENVQQVEKHLKKIQKLAFKSYIEYEKTEIQRILNSNFSVKKKQYKLDKIAERVKNQRRRAVVNIEKIEKGAFIQIEVCRKLAFKAIKKGRPPDG